jgi:hypothetical protein
MVNIAISVRLTQIININIKTMIIVKLKFLNSTKTQSIVAVDYILHYFRNEILFQSLFKTVGKSFKFEL